MDWTRLRQRAFAPARIQGQNPGADQQAERHHPVLRREDGGDDKPDREQPSPLHQAYDRHDQAHDRERVEEREAREARGQDGQKSESDVRPVARDVHHGGQTMARSRR